MKRVLDSNISKFNNTLLKGGLAAASPGLAALVASFTVPQSFLHQYTGMGSTGMAALGVIFFYAAFLFTRGRAWAGFPAIVVFTWAAWKFAANAVGLLSLYYRYNPVTTINDVIAPFPVISLQLTFVFIAVTLGVVIIKAFRLCRTLSPQPVNRLVLGSLGLWLMVVILDCMNQPL